MLYFYGHAYTLCLTKAFFVHRLQMFTEKSNNIFPRVYLCGTFYKCKSDIEAREGFFHHGCQIGLIWKKKI